MRRSRRFVSVQTGEKSRRRRPELALLGRWSSFAFAVCFLALLSWDCSGA